VEEPIDLVVSGINPNANLGHDVTYSGTVTAAMEAAIANIPGLAVSLDTPEGHSGPRDYSAAAHFARLIAEKVMENGLPKDTLLSINVPYLPVENIKGIQITRQGLRVYRDELVKREDPRGKPYYWIGGDWPTTIPKDGTDSGALKAGYVSVTPLQLDLTDNELMEKLKDWEF
jgi:5'-nucleotidase